MKINIRDYLLLLPGIGYILLMIVFAFVSMVAQSFGFFNYTGESAFSLQYWAEIFTKSFFDDLFYSVKIAFLTAFISILLCYPLSLFLQKIPGRKLILSIIKIPMFIPGLVAGYLITNIIDYHGILNQIMMALNIIEEPLRMRNDSAGIGSLVVQLWKNVPFQMMIMYSAIESIRKDVIDAARNLGAGRLQVLREVIIPLSLPSALVAVIMVFIQTFNDFSIAKTTGPLYPTTISNLMYQYAYTFFEWNSAACIGVLMTFTSLLFVVIYTAVSKRMVKS